MKASLRVSRPQSTPDTNDQVVEIFNNKIRAKLFYVQSFPSTNGTTSSPGTNVTNQQNHSADQPSESTCGEVFTFLNCFFISQLFIAATGSKQRK